MQLRDRISVAFTGYGLASGLLLGAAVSIAFFVVEDTLLDHFLTETVEQLRATPRDRNDLLLPRGFEYYGEEVPTELQGLREGRHEIAQFRHVAVFTLPDTGRTAYLVLDESTAGFDVLLGQVLFGTLIAIFAAILVGILLARRITAQLVQPLDTLVARVDAVSAERPLLEPLARDDEIGFLSQRFAHTLATLHEHDRRERDFTRFASHELRSPITVLRGSHAILKADDKLAAPARRVLRRAELATDKMSRLVETFLSLARGNERVNLSPIEAVDLQQIIEREVDARREIADELELAVVREPGEFLANRTLLGVLLENLVSNAAQHGNGQLAVRIQPPIIEFRNFVTEDDTSGHGFGLEIAERICERLGYDIKREFLGDSFVVRLTDRNSSADQD